MRRIIFLAIAALVLTLLAIATYYYQSGDFKSAQVAPTPTRLSSGDIPNFRSYTDVKEKKSAFFSYMVPMVRYANTQVLTDRTFVARIITEASYNDEESQRLLALWSKYKLPATTSVNVQQLSRLMARVDIVPTSLVLAQSANESAWGTSRFATEANNFFGIWCFSNGCGLTPKNRDEGLHHEVARFDSVQSGVIHYIHTINTHPAYESLRVIRSGLRSDDLPLSGIAIADGLVRYSERGMAYVNEIQAMIRYNKLHEYNLIPGAI